MNTVQLCLRIVSFKGLEYWDLDIKNPIIFSKLKEKIIFQPSLTIKMYLAYVRQTVRNFYGLKQDL
jgi:hypothetical protein